MIENRNRDLDGNLQDIILNLGRMRLNKKIFVKFIVKIRPIYRAQSTCLYTSFQGNVKISGKNDLSDNIYKCKEWIWTKPTELDSDQDPLKNTTRSLPTFYRSLVRICTIIIIIGIQYGGSWSAICDAFDFICQVHLLNFREDV